MTLDKRVAIVKDVVIHPVRAFREISENSKYFLPGAIVLFFFSAVFFAEGAIEGAVSMGSDIFFISILYIIGRSLVWSIVASVNINPFVKSPFIGTGGNIEMNKRVFFETAKSAGFSKINGSTRKEIGNHVFYQIQV